MCVLTKPCLQVRENDTNSPKSQKHKNVKYCNADTLGQTNPSNIAPEVEMSLGMG